MNSRQWLTAETPPDTQVSRSAPQWRSAHANDLVPAAEAVMCLCLQLELDQAEILLTSTPANIRDPHAFVSDPKPAYQPQELP